MSTEDGRAEVETWVDQPWQPVEPLLKQDLAELRKGVPRFLFRGFNNTAPDYSGGQEGLNTTSAATPLAYLNRPPGSVESVLDRGEEALKSMLDAHLSKSRCNTQFSLWAASLAVAFEYAQSRSQPYIAIVDTARLRECELIAHVPALASLQVTDFTFHEEYLIHGIVSGPAYKAVPLHQFTKIGFPAHPIWGASHPGSYYPQSCRLHEQTEKERTQSFDEALQVARQYGPHFTLPVFLAIVCSRFKHECFLYGMPMSEPPILRRELFAIAAHIEHRKLSVPCAWVEERTIGLENAVDVNTFMDVQMLLLCMRLAVCGRYPVRLAKRWPGMTRARITRDEALDCRFSPRFDIGDYEGGADPDGDVYQEAAGDEYLAGGSAAGRQAMDYSCYAQGLQDVDGGQVVAARRAGLDGQNNINGGEAVENACGQGVALMLVLSDDTTTHHGGSSTSTQAEGEDVRGEQAVTPNHCSDAMW